MAKEITSTLKLQIPAGQANPAPPVGPALGFFGQEFHFYYQKAAGCNIVEKSSKHCIRIGRAEQD